jgi:hypothetical protein
MDLNVLLTRRRAPTNFQWRGQANWRMFQIGIRRLVKLLASLQLSSPRFYMILFHLNALSAYDMSEIDYDPRNNPFAYPSAFVGRRIWLLRLWTGSSTDQLAYFLEEVDLDSSGIRFIATPYVWGDPRDTGMSICDARVMRI